MSDSLTSTENSRRSSRSPSPMRASARRIPQQAPYDPKSRYPTWLRALISGWFYYSSLIFTLLLLLTLGHYYLSIDFCEANEYIDCRPCPPFYNCSKTTLSCDGYAHNGICLPNNSTIFKFYSKNYILLEELVKNGTVNTVEEIRSHQPFVNESSRTLSLLVSMVDGFKVKNGKIVKAIPENVRFSIVISTFIISLTCFLVSLYFRNKPPQF